MKRHLDCYLEELYDKVVPSASTTFAPKWHLQVTPPKRVALCQDEFPAQNQISASVIIQTRILQAVILSKPSFGSQPPPSPCLRM